MPLTIRLTGLGHGVYKDAIDYGVFSGVWLIGRIYERKGFPNDVRFFWSLHGIVLTRPPDIHTDGYTPSLEAAKAEFKRSWVRWLEWSELGAPREFLNNAVAQSLKNVQFDKEQSDTGAVDRSGALSAQKTRAPCTRDKAKPILPQALRCWCVARRTVLSKGRVVMPTAKEYRQHARECLQLASTAVDFYVKSALTELAHDFQEMAELRERPTINAGQQR
jgi:hypothetical protein